ncbi:MAG: hypothetical protein AAF141_02960 [Pseudomonadota bacterium]
MSRAASNGAGRAAPRLIGNFYRRPVARYAGLCRNLGGVALVVLLAAMGLFRFRFIEATQFLWAMGAVVALGLFALFAALAAMRDIFDQDAAGSGRTAWGVLFAVLALAPLIWSGTQAIIHPKLNDVATDALDFPAFDALVARRAGTPWPSGQLTSQSAGLLREAYPGLGPHGYSTDLDRVAQAVAKLGELRRWETIAAPAIAQAEPQRASGEVPLPRSPQRDAPDEATSTLLFEFVDRSLILNVPTDVVVRLSQIEDITAVDARAAGRHTAHDLGRGAAILTSFLNELDIELLGVAGEGSFTVDDDSEEADALPVPQSSDALALE